MWIDPVNVDELLSTVKPMLASTADELASRVRARWSVGQLCPLLQHDDVDVRKVTCVVLGLIGTRGEVGCVAGALRDEDSAVAELAEHAIWSIWFRAGTPEALTEFQRGLGALEREDAEGAVARFKAARRIDPGFAEAYNQSAIAHFMMERWADAAADCRRTVALMPQHFGALAGLGHCHAQLGELDKAANCYRRALSIHPRLEGIRRMLERIEEGV